MREQTPNQAETQSVFSLGINAPKNVRPQMAHAKKCTSPNGSPDFRLVAITELIRNSYELFVVAHEYSHILLGHLQKADNSDEQNSDPKNKDEIINLVINNWYEEHAADIQAAVLTINAMQGFDFATSYMGVDICLITLIILERINDLLDKKSEAVSSHPPAENRRKFIFNVLSNEHKEIKGIYEINTYIVDSLWERCMYLILEIKKLFEEKLNMKITDIDYNLTRTVLYKIGEQVLTRYNEENPLV